MVSYTEHDLGLKWVFRNESKRTLHVQSCCIRCLSFCCMAFCHYCSTSNSWQVSTLFTVEHEHPSKWNAKDITAIFKTIPWQVKTCQFIYCTVSHLHLGQYWSKELPDCHLVALISLADCWDHCLFCTARAEEELMQQSIHCKLEDDSFVLADEDETVKAEPVATVNWHSCVELVEFTFD